VADDEKFRADHSQVHMVLPCIMEFDEVMYHSGGGTYIEVSENQVVLRA
jgi:hypothetical protein